MPRRTLGDNGTRMKHRGTRSALFIAALLGLAIFGWAQRGRFTRNADDDSIPERPAEFNFLRVEYTDYGRGFGFVSRRGQAGGWWAQDWPDAEEHFTRGVSRLTRIDA